MITDYADGNLNRRTDFVSALKPGI